MRVSKLLITKLQKEVGCDYHAYTGETTGCALRLLSDAMLNPGMKIYPNEDIEESEKKAIIAASKEVISKLEFDYFTFAPSYIIYDIHMNI